jgi:protoporphyrinogen IX oxidase
MEISYGVLKALHVVFVITWFAGLFYIFRLFIYHREASDKSEPERSILIDQFKIMERRLMYAITWPSAILATVFGTWMLILNTALFNQGFMQIKLVFVGLLWLYHEYAQYVLKQMGKGKMSWTSTRLRIINEVPTVILIAVVFLIILRNSIDWIYGVVGILGVAILLMIAIKMYKKYRERP